MFRKITLIAAAVLAMNISSAGVAEAANLSIIDGDHDVITNGPGLASFGHSSTSYARTAPGHASAIAAGDTIIIEERGADNSTAADYASFISGGGRVILLGSFLNSTESLFNGIFGSSIDFADQDGGCCLGGPFSKTGAAAGTTFADGAMTLGDPSSTHRVLSGLPGTAQSFYENAGGESVVFRMTLGAGDLFYVGWDFCCGSATEEDDYYDVLNSAIEFQGSAAIPLPAGGVLMATGLFGLAALRRRRRNS